MQLLGSTKAETQIRASFNWHCCLASTLKFVFQDSYFKSVDMQNRDFFPYFESQSLKCKDQDFCF